MAICRKSSTTALVLIVHSSVPSLYSETVTEAPGISVNSTITSVTIRLVSSDTPEVIFVSSTPSIAMVGIVLGSIEGTSLGTVEGRLDKLGINDGIGDDGTVHEDLPCDGSNGKEEEGED